MVRKHLASSLLIKLKRVRDMATATLIQTTWRTTSKVAIYKEMRSAIILLQSMVRMKLAIIHKFKLISKLKAAVTLSVDFFCFSKNRNAAATKIQAICRMFAAMRLFILCLEKRSLAAIQIQSIYRMYRGRCSFLVSRTIADIAATTVQAAHRRYLARTKFLLDFMEYSQERRMASSKIQSVYRMYMARQIFIGMKFTNDNLVTIEDCKKSYGCSKNRQFAATVIQALFRKHSARSSYLDLFSLRGTLSSELDQNKVLYPTEIFFQRSKQRRDAAIKIQTAYRKHLFRVTCVFRFISYDDDSSVETEKDCLSLVGSPVFSVTQSLFCNESLLETFQAIMCESEVDLSRFLRTDMLCKRS